MLRVARPLAASVVSLGVIAAATGWLYLIQPHSALPGPPVTDALPLDELSRRSAVPLLVFLAVWITAALLLGLIARAARADRLTAGLLLAPRGRGWGFRPTRGLLFVVRRGSSHPGLPSPPGWKGSFPPPPPSGGSGGTCC